jgi:hypothetical protein
MDGQGVKESKLKNVQEFFHLDVLQTPMSAFKIPFALGHVCKVMH